MKKIFLFALGLVALSFGCSQEEPLMKIEEEPQVDNATPAFRTEAQAREAALNAYQFISPARGRSVPLITDIVTVYSGKGRSRSSDPLYYALNYDGGGYALIAANPRLDPVVAVIEQGEFTSEEDIEVPGFRMYLNSFGDANEGLLDDSLPLLPHEPLLPNPIDTTPGHQLMLTKDTIIETVTNYGPYLPVNWGNTTLQTFIIPRLLPAVPMSH